MEDPLERRRRLSPPCLVLATLTLGALSTLATLSISGCQKGDKKGQATAASASESESASEPAPSTSTSASASAAAEASASASDAAANGAASASGLPSTGPTETSPSPSQTTGTTASAVTSASASSGAPTCGEKGQPKCPLQGWMSTVMQPAMASKDATKLAAALRQSAKYAPPGYARWAKIANDGAAAVEASHDVTSGKKSCTDCHNSYKSKFKTEVRARPL